MPMAKIVVHAHYINLYLHEFFEPILFDSSFRPPWTQRKIWPILKSSNISETGKAMPTKIGIHAHYINLYLREFFEPILFDSNF